MVTRGWMLLVALAGCWAQEDLVHGEFTPAQWDALTRDFALPPLAGGCDFARDVLDPSQCEVAALFGQRLFFDRRLSGTGTLSCAGCHDPAHGFADASNVSATVGAPPFTRRNTMSLVNLAYKAQLTDAGFTWNGRSATPSQVVELVAIPGPMASSAAHVASVLRSDYGYTNLLLLGTAPATDDGVFRIAQAALEAYMRRLISVDAPFDRFLAGDEAAMPEAAIRGLGVFVGRGMCLECHAGPMLSDFAFHATGVPQTGANVGAVDLGRAEFTNLVEDEGKFLTPPLRNLSQTWPYMHQGWDTTLGDVLDHYRRGGADGGFAGSKDPRMVPAEITDEDVADLESFLSQLTGTEIPATLRLDPFGNPAARAACVTGRCTP